MRALILCLSLLVICQSQADFDSSDSDEHGQYKGIKSTNCTCGTTNKGKRRIVNGRETHVNEYPFMSAIGRRSGGGRYIYCGATIITPYHLITAAHCTADDPPSQLKVIVGEHDLYDIYETPHTRIYDVYDKKEHEKYDPYTTEYDIAVISTTTKIVFNEGVGPACLPHKPIELVHQKVRVIGWGDTQSEGSASPVLMKVVLQVIDYDKCAAQYHWTNMAVNKKAPHQFCTFRENKDSCQGDSGGPVVWLDWETNRYVLVGIVSFGEGCADPNYAGVNTDVYAFIPWIQNAIAATSTSRAYTCAKID